MLAAYVTLFLLTLLSLLSIACAVDFIIRRRPVDGYATVALITLLIITNTILFHFEPTIR